MQVESPVAPLQIHDGPRAAAPPMRFGWQGPLIAFVLAAGMWFYVGHVLIGHQLAEAARLNAPRGNLSDLYPRWLGARELLLAGRNPYSPAVTREIQMGYWGRVLDARNPRDPKDEARFAYPAYVVFFLAPTVWFSFRTAQLVFAAVLALGTAASVPWWLRAFRLRASATLILTLQLLTLGSWPVVQALHLQQLTLLVAALLAAAAAALTRGRLGAAGVLLAAATIKPQLAAPLGGWVLLWSLAKWSERKRVFAGFFVALAALVLAAEILLPGWIGAWLAAVPAYLTYNATQSVLQVVFGDIVGGALRYVLILAMLAICVRFRRQAAGTNVFSAVTALVITTGLVITPAWHPYDQVLLLPAILWLGFAVVSAGLRRTVERLACGIAAVFLLWGWITALALDVAVCLSPWLADRYYGAPLFASFVLPVAVLLALAFRGTDVLRHHAT